MPEALCKTQPELLATEEGILYRRLKSASFNRRWGQINEDDATAAGYRPLPLRGSESNIYIIQKQSPLLVSGSLPEHVTSAPSPARVSSGRLPIFSPASIVRNDAPLLWTLWSLFLLLIGLLSYSYENPCINQATIQLTWSKFPLPLSPFSTIPLFSLLCPFFFPVPFTKPSYFQLHGVRGGL